MASVFQHTRGGWYLQIRMKSGRRKQVYLGLITKKQSNTFAAHVSALERANRLNIEATEAVQWALGLETTLQEQLRESGVLRVSKVVDWKLSNWIDRVIEKHTGKGSTPKGLKTAKKHWIALLGDRSLTATTTGDCREGAEYLAATYSSSHANRLCERGKMFFQLAVDHKLIPKNPFDGIKFVSRKIDKQRQCYVTHQNFTKIVENARHQEARVLFLLARYGGLRVPSEPLSLVWNHCDWNAERISIPNETKTGFRILPMFPEIKSALFTLWDMAPDKSTEVFTIARKSAGTTWAEWLTEAITKANQTRWPKLWMNLRASCRTDLEDRFPSHVCDAWLGHSTKVARDHYLRVTPDHWKEAKRTVTTPCAQSSAQQ